jgi:hypothetical protein
LEALDPRAGVYIVRTALEDGMLQKELVGYRAYAHDVRRRLLPGIWQRNASSDGGQTGGGGRWR